MPITIYWSDGRARSLVCDRIETVGQIVPRAIDPSQNVSPQFVLATLSCRTDGRSIDRQSSNLNGSQL
jgi:hypothetical protein